MRRFWLFSAIFVLSFSCRPAIAADPTPEELKQKFQETLSQSKLEVTVSGGKLSGPGAQFLNAHAASAQFVMLGEEHGVATIADTVRQWFPDLARLGYRHLAVEADPYMTAKLEAALRSGGSKAVAKMLSVDEAKFALPFYNWVSEAELANAVVKANPASSPALWGLDQVFIGAYGLLLRDIASGANSADARSLASSLADQARGDLAFLSKTDLAQFEKLRSLLNDERDASFAKLVDDMILSAKIYAPFIGKPGLSVHVANTERENYMKRRFQSLYEQAGRPKVAFKFGSYHMSRGLSGTHVLSLASFVTDTALMQGAKSFNVLLLCGPGTKAAQFQGTPADCEMSVAKDFPDLVGLVDSKQPTLFDLAPWKDKPRRWEHLSADVQSLVWAYDAILFIPNGKPAEQLK